MPGTGPPNKVYKSNVIPACFWPESRETGWMPVFASMTGNDWTLYSVALC
jgi:hypothetical protein